MRLACPQKLTHDIHSFLIADDVLDSSQDTSWLAQSSGFVTETQTFYITMPGKRLAMCQVIHSAIGLVEPFHLLYDLHPLIQDAHLPTAI
jgi:hypothetical protein